MKTNNERQASFKERMKEQGYKRVEVYAPTSRVDELKKFAEELRNEINRT